VNNRPDAARTILARRAALAAGLVLAAVILVLGLRGGGGPRRLVPGGANAAGTFDPLAFSSARMALLEQAATEGLSHVLYAKSPGGILAAARRTAAFRPLIDAAARTGPIDADTLEAIVLLESSGRADVVAGADPSAAAGLTQIVAQTGTGLLGMRIDLAASRRLAARIATATGTRAAALRAQRARVDPRFDPASALAATEHYLTIARRTFGRDDLTVESYHMGIGNLQSALRRFGGATSYAELYIDSTPLAHADAYRFLAGLGDDSQTYLWRVYAARQAMALYRRDPAGLARQAALQTAAPSAELALRPPAKTPVLADPAALARARASGALVGLPPDAATRGLRADGPFHLRLDALAVALYIAAAVRAVSHTTATLELTAATTDAADLARAGRAGHGLADSDRLHATGYAFDLARAYASPAQALALQFILDRLQALDVIAWQRHARIIHVVAGPRAALVRGVLSSA
jgi:hypothetical protein